MADSKISDLDAAGSLTGDELVPLVPNTHFAISLYLRNHLLAAGAP